MPIDARRGNDNAKMEDDDPRLPALINSLEYLLCLGEVHATQAVATLLVDGATGHANHNDTVENVYLPIWYWTSPNLLLLVSRRLMSYC